MRCGRAQRLLAAAVDGELAPRPRRALDRHLAACEVCRRELAATERMLHALEALPIEAVVSDRLEQATLRRVRHLAAEDAEGSAARGWRAWLSIPVFALASAAVAVLAIGIVRQGRETPGAAVVQPRRESAERLARAPVPVPQPAEHARAPRAAEPPSEPPPALAAAPELFVDLPILRNLEKLSHFEAIRTTTLDDETPSGEEPPSNG